jgi:hypothetical protein
MSVTDGKADIIIADVRHEDGDSRRLKNCLRIDGNFRCEGN